jgi:hypothetical protein
MLAFENNIIAGCTVPTKYGASTSAATGFTDAAMLTWFNSKGNSIVALGSDAKIAAPWAPAGTTPNFTPASGSPLLTGGVFTHTKLTSGFFTSVTYRGAVKDAADTWYAGWTNYNL